VFEMGLYARRVVEGLVVAEVREGFWVLFELRGCQSDSRRRNGGVLT
jgi:hypothetical protein